MRVNLMQVELWLAPQLLATRCNNGPAAGKDLQGQGIRVYLQGGDNTYHVMQQYCVRCE